jgi:hypothetical protein
MVRFLENNFFLWRLIFFFFGFRIAYHIEQGQAPFYSGPIPVLPPTFSLSPG